MAGSVLNNGCYRNLASKQGSVKVHKNLTAGDRYVHIYERAWSSYKKLERMNSKRPPGAANEE